MEYWFVDSFAVFRVFFPFVSRIVALDILFLNFLSLTASDTHAHKLKNTNRKHTLSGTHLHIHLYAWIVRLVPAHVTPNSITFVNILVQCSYLLLWLVRGDHHDVALIVTLVLYRILDNVDGLHARSTRQCSRFGEFLVRLSPVLLANIYLW